MHAPRPSSPAVIAVTGAALFMIVLDNMIGASTLPTAAAAALLGAAVMLTIARGALVRFAAAR